MLALVTGHTGFKGAWLSLLLQQRGFNVAGIALDPEPGSLYEVANVGSFLVRDVRCDVRNTASVAARMKEMEPDVVIHMAAQPLVRASYEDPRLTIDTNVMGTLSVLEAMRECEGIQAAVMVTTDKVYRNVGQKVGYIESDCLGGHDPYSASKAMADILVSSWSASFPRFPIGIARAGNVIGGGDISPDRLMPDAIRSFSAGSPVNLRNPQAVRPWQHVLDCLNGYLKLVDALIDGTGQGAWNFGPDPTAFRTVREAVETAAVVWGDGATWVVDAGEHPHEADMLTLDSSRSHSDLHWEDVLNFNEAVSWTIEWARRVRDGESPLDVTLEQLQTFNEFATKASR